MLQTRSVYLLQFFQKIVCKLCKKASIYIYMDICMDIWIRDIYCFWQHAITPKLKEIETCPFKLQQIQSKRPCIPNFRPIGAVGASLWSSQNAIFGKKLQKVITAFWPARLRGGGDGHLCACQRSDVAGFYLKKTRDFFENRGYYESLQVFIDTVVIIYRNLSLEVFILLTLSRSHSLCAEYSSNKYMNCYF